MEATCWDDVLGNRALKENLQKAVSCGKVSHAYIIQGEKYSGKKMIADLFARSIMCEHNKKGGMTKLPCNSCKACRQAIGENNPDIIRVSHEKPNVISVENIRQQINNDIVILPYSSDYKIYIVDEAEKMNVQAQNALLKTLEEPPSYAVIILLAATTSVLLPTILSRCVRLDIKPVFDDEIKTYLMNNARLPDYRAGVCAAFARGNIGRAKLLATDEDFDSMKASVTNTLKNIDGMEINKIYSEIKRLQEEKYNIDDYLDMCFIWYRDVLLLKASGDMSRIIFRENASNIQRLSKSFEYDRLERIIRAIERTRSRIKANVSQELSMELMFMEMKDF